MKTVNMILVLCLVSTLPLFSQLQYTSVPKSGEGRFPRASTAAFWVNPIFLKPSVFFSSDASSLRGNRKWWRAESRQLPVPSTTWTVPAIALIKEDAFRFFIGEGHPQQGDFAPGLLRYESIFHDRAKPFVGRLGLP